MFASKIFIKSDVGSKITNGDTNRYVFWRNKKIKRVFFLK
jgi:hypothetical protein